MIFHSKSRLGIVCSSRSLDHTSTNCGDKVSQRSFKAMDDVISDVTESTLGFLSETFSSPNSSFTKSHSSRALNPNPRKRNEVDLTITKLHFEALGLHGRDEELKILNDCFDRASSGAIDRQLVLISGFSGTGKTVLADSLRKLANKRRGVYVQGKFELNATYQSLTNSARPGERDSIRPGVRDSMRTGARASIRPGVRDSIRPGVRDIIRPGARNSIRPGRPGSNSMRRSSHVFRFESNSYGAITSACSAICSHIISLQASSPETFKRICKRIREDLGTELSLLIRFVPAVEALMGFDDQELILIDIPTPSSEAAKNRLHFALQRFVRVVSDEFAPLVLVLDDLQFADPSSLELIEALLSDQKTNKLIVVGTYRSNEVDEAHIFYHSLEGFRGGNSTAGFQMTEITIGNLDIDAVDSVLRDLLSMDPSEKMLNLAELCHKRTLGNAFFLLHFISMLHDRKLVDFNLGLMGWNWDLDKIKGDTSVSDNVVDLLKAKMVELSPTEIAILKVAACLGSFFEEHTARLALEGMYSELFLEGDCEQVVKEGLATLEHDGYIYNLSTSHSTAGNSYGWAHDKIHESATSLVESATELPAFCFRIGRILLSRMGQADLDSALFVVVNLLNQATLVITEDVDSVDEEERIKVAELNYRAAKKAMSLSAFESAAAYAEHGVDTLPQNCWADHYKLSLRLYSVRAKMTGCLGYVEVMEQYCNEVISRENIPLDDKLPVYEVLVDHLQSQGKSAEAADLILGILKRFGCLFPKRPTPVSIHVITNLIKTKRMAKTLDVDGLHGMMNSTRSAMVNLVDKLSNCWFLMDDGRLPLASFCTLNWTIKYGYSDVSSIAFAQGAMLLTGVLNDLQAGSALGKQALKLAEKTPWSWKNARTKFLINAFVLSWTVPLAQLQKPLLLAYDAGLACGDPDTSMWSVMIWMLSRLVVGNALEQLESDFLLYLSQMKDLGTKRQFYICKYVRQVLLNLMGRNNRSRTDLIGESFTEEDMAYCNQDKFFAPGLIMYQGILLTYFGEHIRQADAAVKTGHKYHRHSLTVPYDHFLKGVSCYIAAGLTKQRKYSRMAGKLRSKIKRWSVLGNPNVKHYEYFLDAEHAAFVGRIPDAIRNYEAAILFAARSGIQHDAAFANERFGAFHLSVMNDKIEAKYRIKQAIICWKEWGALGKVQDLERKYGSIMLNHASGSTSCMTSGDERELLLA